MVDHKRAAPMWSFKCAPSPQACRHTPAPARPPEAHTEIFCRRRSHWLRACDGL